MFPKFDFCLEDNLHHSEKELSICLRAHGFSFSLHNNERQLIKLSDFDILFPERLTEVMNVVKTAFSNAGITAFTFSSTSTIFQAVKHVWAPEVLFDGNHIKKYLKFVCCVDDTEQIQAIYSPLLKAYSIFAVNPNIFSAFKILTPSASFLSQHIVMAEKGLELTDNQRNTIILNIRTKGVDIAAYKKKEFVLGNSFSFEGEEELVYFVLNVIKQLQFDLNITNCYVGGTVDDVILFRLRTFIPNVDIFPLSSETESIGSKSELAKYFLIL